MRNQDPRLHNLKLMKQIVPSMRYDGKTSFQQWQNESRAKLIELLGLPFKPCDLHLEIEYEKEIDNAREIRFTFQSEEGYFVPCHFMIPKTAARPLPVVICLQGHTMGMHVSLGRQKYNKENINKKASTALWVLKNGYCALVMEQRNFGENGGTENGPDCYCSTMAAQLIGRTTIGERVWDVQRAIDVLEKHFPEADSGNIMCTGGSGGGTATYYAACIDERIKAAMPCCAVCEYEDSISPINHCSCNFIPRIREYFEMGDLGGLIAPRKLIIITGRHDPIFPLHGVKKSFDTIKRMYDFAGCAENKILEINDGGHDPCPEIEWPAFNKMVSGSL